MFEDTRDFWRGWHHHLPLVTAARTFCTRRLGPKAQAPA